VSSGKKQKVIVSKARVNYVILDLQRPWYLVDQGCDWLYGSCQDSKSANDFMEAVSKTKENYKTIFSQNGFSILKLYLFKKGKMSCEILFKI